MRKVGPMSTYTNPKTAFITVAGLVAAVLIVAIFAFNGNVRSDETRLARYELCVDAGGVPVENGRVCVWGDQS